MSLNLMPLGNPLSPWALLLKDEQQLPHQDAFPNRKPTVLRKGHYRS